MSLAPARHGPVTGREHNGQVRLPWIMTQVLRWRAAAARIPERLDDLRGPELGTVVLHVHLTWHGLREFDVADDGPRLCLYTIVLSQGKRNDIARFVHPRLLLEDWPRLRTLVAPRVRDVCTRRFGLDAAGVAGDTDRAGARPGMASGE